MAQAALRGCVALEDILRLLHLGPQHGLFAQKAAHLAQVFVRVGLHRGDMELLVGMSANKGHAGAATAPAPRAGRRRRDPARVRVAARERKGRGGQSEREAGCRLRHGNRGFGYHHHSRPASRRSSIVLLSVFGRRLVSSMASPLPLPCCLADSSWGPP